MKKERLYDEAIVVPKKDSYSLDEINKIVDGPENRAHFLGDYEVSGIVQCSEANVYQIVMCIYRRS